MARHYTDVETKLVAELRPGDQLIARRTVTEITLTTTGLRAVFNDGTSHEWSLTDDPSVEVVAQ